MGESIYIGMGGDVKKLYSRINGKPIGAGLGAIGKLLVHLYGDMDEVDEIFEKLKKENHNAGHSGCSQIIAIGMLFEIIGNGSLTEAEKKYILELKEKEVESVQG